MLDPRIGLRVVNGIAEDKPNHPFWICMSNFTRTVCKFRKAMVIEYTRKSTLTFADVAEEISREVSKCLNITGEAPQG